jgi:probable F420-dependent oxidoreductase
MCRVAARKGTKIVKFGLQWFCTDETVTPSRLAPMVEERGFESLFVTEHTHIPVSRRTLGPTGEKQLPREYSRTLDPFVAVAAAAVTTSRLKVGTGILLVAQHDPLITAKAVASLDLLSEGRVLFGVGPGWNVEEAEDHGISGPSRWAVMREHVDAIRALWSHEVAEYQGRYVSFEPCWSWPKPRFALPILVAGNGPHALDRVLAIGDEWAPADEGESRMIERLAELRSRCDDQARSPIPTTLFAPTADPRVLERYEDAGVHRAVYPLASLRDRGEMERELDRLSALVSAYDRVEAPERRRCRWVTSRG